MDGGYSAQHRTDKVDSVTKAPLAGAQFKVLYADGRVVDTEGGKLSSKGLLNIK